MLSLLWAKKGEVESDVGVGFSRATVIPHAAARRN